MKQLTMDTTPGAADDAAIRAAWDKVIDTVHDIDDLRHGARTHHARHALNHMMKGIRLNLVAEMMSYFGVDEWEETLAALLPTDIEPIAVSKPTQRSNCEH